MRFVTYLLILTPFAALAHAGGDAHIHGLEWALAAAAGLAGVALLGVRANSKARRVRVRTDRDY